MNTKSLSLIATAVLVLTSACGTQAAEKETGTKTAPAASAETNSANKTTEKSEKTAEQPAATATGECQEADLKIDFAKPQGGAGSRFLEATITNSSDQECLLSKTEPKVWVIDEDGLRQEVEVKTGDNQSAAEQTLAPHAMVNYSFKLPGNAGGSCKTISIKAVEVKFAGAGVTQELGENFPACLTQGIEMTGPTKPAN
ncbi:hypothetical protein BSR29_05195 [Boudabousia liubingyangii]|uniref:DUF4232 domain-containing protein n=1 Tax=Boudabousia liubingyangii TaxID=1921764 RepID=A0A1Q5PLG3_9ACTO|nr:DUF4232 domain-containing protein [Boudabousia liubingyangii]OKL47886.1 hypothetical protein BSR29_05195 [Boudabousia liubingyangii]